MTNLKATCAAKICADRTDAGRQPASTLEHFKSVRPVVLALPRGDVPVACEVPDVLDNLGPGSGAQDRGILAVNLLQRAKT